MTVTRIWLAALFFFLWTDARAQLDALVDGYTRHAAYAMGRSDQLGSIEAGKRADFVILKQNLFEMSRYDIHQARPIAVVMDGELVHGSLEGVGKGRGGDK